MFDVSGVRMVERNPRVLYPSPIEGQNEHNGSVPTGMNFDHNVLIVGLIPIPRGSRVVPVPGRLTVRKSPFAAFPTTMLFTGVGFRL